MNKELEKFIDYVIEYFQEIFDLNNDDAQWILHKVLNMDFVREAMFLKAMELVMDLDDAEQHQDKAEMH